ncbi:MAG: hypothetical protein IPF98_22980 [Gemmatimonadetes bacterium]|nr:hypothetical protein [Gemmatimonadota bacterium]
MLPPRRLFAVAAALLVLPAGALCAQGTQPAGCRTPSHRAFDFWLGEWEVRTPQGAVAGTSRITSILDGCVIHEAWSGTGGSVGESFNIFDATAKRWHQTWVDNQGMLAQFDGARAPDGAMVMEGPARGPAGEPARSRMSFTPLTDGRVRQLWELSIDGGTTWRTTFDGYYTRRAP